MTRSWKVRIALAAMVLAATVKAEEADQEVVSVVFFHRHGDRSPYMEMPNDVENNKKWGIGAGMLTTKGMKQLHEVGATFRERYLKGKPYKVASESYTRGEYYVRSTDMDRTIESALSFISGFYPPGTGPTDTLPGRLQVVPVHTMPTSLDSLLLAFKGSQCTRFLELIAESTSSKMWKTKEKENRDLLDLAANISGYDPATVTLQNISVVSDPLFCEDQHGMSFLQGFRDDPSIFKTLVALEDFTLRPLYARTDEMSRLSGGNMLSQVVSRFQLAAKLNVTVPTIPTGDTPFLEDGTNSRSVKISHFSAHDSTLVSLLGALGIFDDQNPPYASTVVFELVLWQRNYFVRVFYNKGIDNLFSEPQIICPNGASLCPLHMFVSKYRNMIPLDFQGECKSRGKPITDSGATKPHEITNKPKNTDREEVGLWAAIGVALTLMLMLLLCSCGRNMHQFPSQPVFSKYDSLPEVQRRDSGTDQNIGDRI